MNQAHTMQDGNGSYVGSDEMIVIKNLSKTHKGQVKALVSVDLNVRRGEMVALLGASGSGKSTLLRHVSGLMLGDAGAGSIVVDGKVIQANGRLGPSTRMARRHIGFVFQQFNLVGRLSVLTNVMLGGLSRVPLWRSLLGLFPKTEREAGLAALTRVGIAAHAYKRATALSGGQQQRAAIARAIVQRAKVILADEPIASLDPESARRVMQTLVDVNQADGTTVVVSLHQVDMALRYCPRVVALARGRVVYDGPSCELTPAMLDHLYAAEHEQDEAAHSIKTGEAPSLAPGMGMEAFAGT